MPRSQPHPIGRGGTEVDWTDAQRLLVKRAHDVAVRAHQEQTDKAGHAYIGHPSRVAAYLATSHGPQPAAQPEVVAAGWLHDVVEDTPTTLDDLLRMGIPPDVVAIVDALTKRPGETPAEYALRIAASPSAVQVKRADLRDNADGRRMAQLDPMTRNRLTLQYRQFARLLDQAVSSR
ncbi:MAG: HD domain-containing protein [Propionibacteriaceae bacterium]|nr:HD domain-containing protein [Propionibacteriaceae bacterium]